LCSRAELHAEVLALRHQLLVLQRSTQGRRVQFRTIDRVFRAPPLRNESAAGDDLPPVWPWPKGDIRGVALKPLYKTAPVAALRDPLLYELLALVDSIRNGRARERNVAERELVHRLHSHGKP